MSDLDMEDLGGASAPNGKKPGKGNKTIYWVIAVVSLVVAVIAIAYIVRYFSVKNKGEEVYESLQESMTSTETQTQTQTETETSSEETQPTSLEEDMARVIDFASLKEETNEDIYAWIYVPDTNIDYPMVQHPTDNTYYLNYNLDGSKGYPGCIYTEKENAKDFSDFNTVIYGHNMKNGTMFHDLHNFSDKTYMEEHPYAYVYMEGRVLKYQIFAAYKYDDRHLLYAFNYDTEYQREKYVEEIFGQRNMAAVYDEEAAVDSESQVITLSTCIGGQASNRFLVQAVLIDDVDINES